MNVIAAFDENAIIWITLYMGKQDCPPPSSPTSYLTPHRDPLSQLRREQVAFHKASVSLLIVEATDRLHEDKGQIRCDIGSARKKNPFP